MTHVSQCFDFHAVAGLRHFQDRWREVSAQPADPVTNEQANKRYPPTIFGSFVFSTSPLSPITTLSNLQTMVGSRLAAAAITGLREQIFGKRYRQISTVALG